jgi:hypothetical protein
LYDLFLTFLLTSDLEIEKVNSISIVIDLIFFMLRAVAAKNWADQKVTVPDSQVSHK